MCATKGCKYVWLRVVHSGSVHVTEHPDTSRLALGQILHFPLGNSN